MSDRLWIAVLVYPAPLYAGGLVLSQFWGNGYAVALGFLLALGFGTATGLGAIRHPVWVWLGRLLLGLAIFVPLASGSGAGPEIDLAAGVFIGAPFLFLEYAWRDTSTPAGRVVALQSTFVVGIVCLAAAAAAPTVAGSSGGYPFFQAVADVVLGQIQGLAALLLGGTPNGMPLEAVFNVTYAALGGVALLGVVLSGVSPRTALGEPLPWSWVRDRPARPPVEVDDERLGLRPGQREALASRTRPAAPESVFAPGFGALVIAGLLIAGFVALAVEAPSYALLVLVFASVAALFTVGLVLSRRLTPHGGLEA